MANNSFKFIDTINSNLIKRLNQILRRTILIYKNNDFFINILSTLLYPHSKWRHRT